MLSLPKEKVLKYSGRFFLFLTGLVVLFGSLVLTGLEIMANDKKTNNLRSVPIEYTVEMPNGEKIAKIYKVPESRIGPENAEYLIKKMRDRLWVDLSKTAKDKSEVCLLIADKRMFETVELIKNNKDEDLIIKTLDETIWHLKESKKMLSEENKKDIEISKVDQQIDRAGLAYEDIVKSFNYKNEKIDKIINDLESWNQKNIKEEGEN
ncbi:MAG: DUF5667 domain-containing protein [Candidatus Shapirobacteria bacterium]|nr:DUF5667 domain-containing protein [Candidatus Shapirobacteria bacterium]MDD4410104.1 DUF5667 domain-containing protein [Candidatus Shapirobacteria bacterium]